MADWKNVRKKAGKYALTGGVGIAHDIHKKRKQTTQTQAPAESADAGGPTEAVTPPDSGVADEAFTAVGRNGQLTVTPTTVAISRKGVLGFVSQGHKGTKEIAIDQITAIQFKKNGIGTAGYIQFSFMGGSETKQGVFDAVKDENTVLFGKGAEPNFVRAKELIDRYRESRRNPTAPPVVQTGGLHDLEKLAELRDRAVITQEEFEAKKHQILGL